MDEILNLIESVSEGFPSYFWVNRFSENFRKRSTEKKPGELIADEPKKAEIHVIQLHKHMQFVYFQEEWKALSHGQPKRTDSKLHALKSKLDNDGLLRSEGRLRNAKFLSYDVRYPVILPIKSWVTKLIVKDAHERRNHVFGTNHT